MDDICYIDGCPGEGKFTCSCNEALRICQGHITEHFGEAGIHEIDAVKANLTRFKAREAIGSLRKINSSTLEMGKEMFKELCDKLCEVVDNISQRQQYLVDLSSSPYSDQLEEKIEELKTVNITMRDKKQFGELLNKFMSKEPLDTSSFNEFHKDFKVIAESLEKSNNVLQLLASSQQQEQAFREKLESRVLKLEENHGKIENIDQKVTVLDTRINGHENKFESIKKLVDQANNGVKKLENELEIKIALVKNKTIQELEKIQAIEMSIKQAVKGSTDLIESESAIMKHDLSKIRDFSDSGFKNILDEYFIGVCNARIVENK